MRAFVACLAMSALLACPAFAADGDRPSPEPGRTLPGEAAEVTPPSAAPKSDAELRESLFAELKKEASAAKATRIASRIESSWLRSGSPTVDLLIQWSGLAMAKKDSATALDLLDQAVLLKPDYAESWNRRATLHFNLSNYGKSIADIEQTLRREPRHFGALMGLAMILEQADRKQEALESYQRVLDIYPALKAAQDAVGRLAEELSGQAI